MAYKGDGTSRHAAATEKAWISAAVAARASEDHDSADRYMGEAAIWNGIAKRIRKDEDDPQYSNRNQTRNNMASRAPYGGVGTATRYSGNVRLKISYDDARNEYRAAISVLAPTSTGGRIYALRTKQVVGRPPAASGGVDSPVAFDEAAKAALSFAMHEDKIDSSDLQYNWDTEQIHVTRTQSKAKTHYPWNANSAGARRQTSQTCRCGAYPFPHAAGGGACAG
jgi:hypothetical protein